MPTARETEDIARDVIRHHHDHPTPRDVNRESDRREGTAERVAGDFAGLVGTWTFVLIQTLLCIAWLTLNAVAAVHHWDGYPFGLLNLVFSAEAAIGISLLLMAGNRSATRERLRAQAAFEQEVRMEEELRAIMSHLESQDEILIQALHRLDRLDRELRRVARGGGVEREAG